MNVNPSSHEFSKVVPWDSLTDEQKQSGEWIELPDVSGEPRRARKQSMLARVFRSTRSAPPALMHAPKGEFDATGKPR